MTQVPGATTGGTADAGLPDLPEEVDVLVIGAGLMGAMTAMSVTARGLRVLVVEQYAAGHLHGSSHGSARIVRRAYPDDFYVRLTGRAFELWSELERTAGTPLLRITGGIDHGPVRDLPTVVAALAARSIPFELLDPGAARERWPGMRFDGEVLYHAQAGTVDCDRSVEAALAVAAAGGAVIADGTAVTAVRVVADGAVVSTSRGPVRARRVVLAAGAWLDDLGGTIEGSPLRLPPLRVSQQQVFHFARADGVPEWPVTIHKAALSTYSLPGGRDGGPGGARKVAEHHAGGFDTSATGRSGVVDPAGRDKIVDYVRRWLPGLLPEPFAEATCLYTSTANEDFVLDRVGPLVVCSPCSGHGAKFAPLIGELTADLVTGDAAPEQRFALAAHGR